MSQLSGYDLALQQQFGMDRINRKTATRRFVVPTVYPIAALQAPEIPGLTTEHPEDPTLYLDRYNVSSNADGTCTIDCLYSNDRRYVELRAPNKDADAWYHWGWASRQVQVEIPIAVRTAIINLDSGGAAQQKLVWKVAKKQVTEIRVIRPLTVRVKTNSVRVFDVIAAQTNKLHVIRGGTYLFEGGTVSQVDDFGTYDVSYTWSVDRGTTFFPPTGSPLISYCSGPSNRAPYTVFAVVQDGNPETTLPKCFLQDLYETDATGWQSLPGAGVL